MWTARNISQRISHILYLLSVLSDRLKRHRMMKSISRALLPRDSAASKLNIVYGISQADIRAETRCYYTPRLARHAIDVDDR